MWACCEQRLEAPASLSLVAGSQPHLRQSTEILASQAELYFQKRFELFCSRSPSPPRADCLATLSDKCSPTHDFLDKFGIMNTTPSLSETSPGSGRAKGGVYGLHLRMHTLLWGWFLLQGWWCPSAFWVVSASSPGLPRTTHHSRQQWMSFRVAARCKEGRWRSSASWCQVKKGRIWAGPQVTVPHAASGESSQPIS